MKTSVLLAFTIALISGSALADSVKGNIIAYDRVAKVIVLGDKTVWPMENADLALPDDLKAGDMITIEFESAGENALSKITSIMRDEG